MSTCDDYRARVCLFLDNELRGDELQDFQEHIVECPDCKDVLMREHALSGLLRRNRPLYHAPDSLLARVSDILLSDVHSDRRAPERLRQRILRILASPLRSFAQPSFRWKQLAAVGLVTLFAFLFTPPMVQHVRANAFVETAAETYRSFLEGNLPMQINTSSPAAVTSWFTGKVPEKSLCAGEFGRISPRIVVRPLRCRLAS